jgi:undecaprenyl-diphosphatase
VKKLFLVILIINALCKVTAETNYTYDAGKDIMLGLISTSVFAMQFFIQAPFDEFAPAKENINVFDRQMMFAFNKPLDVVSYAAAYGFAAAPAFLLVNNFDAGTLSAYGIMYAEALLLVPGTCGIIKNSAGRLRPYNYFGVPGTIPPGQSNEYNKSFPSQHTAFAFMTAGFLTSVLVKDFADSGGMLKALVIGGGYTAAAAIGASRILSGNHFFTDVLAGAAIGSVYGYLIPALHVRKKQNDVELVFTPSVNGFIISCALP